MTVNQINLFGTPLYFNNIKIKEKDKKNLINSDYKRLESNNGFVTKDKYILNKNINLKKIVLNHLKKYLYENLKIKKDVKFKMLNSWCMKHKNNDWSINHCHDNSFISGILYLKTKENSGNLIFYRNKLLNIFPTSVGIEFEEFNETNCNFFYMKPKEGDIIFFPSNLEHSVTKNLSNEDRYCCSFNFYPTGIFGRNDDLNVLKI